MKKYIPILIIITTIFYTTQTNFDTHFQASINYLLNKNLDAALTSAQNAYAQLAPDTNKQLLLANTLLQIGSEYFEQWNPQKAIAAFYKIIEISPLISCAYHNIAFTLAERMGEYHAAIKVYEMGLNYSPDDAETHFGYAMALLATGDLARGFKEYEWRQKRDLERKSRRSLSMPLSNQWNGESLTHKRLLLRAEQGLGDTLQFVRYADIFKKRGATIILECQKQLIDILSLCNYIDELIVIGDPLPPYDYQLLLMSCPHALSTTKETIPHTPYLYANTNLIRTWRKRLAHNNRLKVGLSWQGDPAHGPRKFPPLEEFSKLTELKNISFYSLQYNSSAPNSIITFSDLDTTSGRFMDTAALMKNLDIFITVDTSLAHLAGGLGIKTWVILPFPAEWRWLMNTTQSPWYPSMKLFRQTETNSWHNVIENIKHELMQQIVHS